MYLEHIKNLPTDQKGNLNLLARKDSKFQELNTGTDHCKHLLRDELIAVYPYCGNYFIITCYWFKFIATIYLGGDHEEAKKLCLDVVLEIYQLADKTTSVKEYDNILNDQAAKDIILKCFQKHNYFEKGVDYQGLLDTTKLTLSQSDRQILSNLLFPVPDGDLTVNGLFSSTFLNNLFLRERLDLEILVNAKLLVILEIFQWLKTFIRIIIISRKQQFVSANPKLYQLFKYPFSESLADNYQLIYTVYTRYFSHTLAELLYFEDLAILADMVNRHHETLAENNDILLPIEKDINDFLNKTRVNGIYVFKKVSNLMPQLIKNMDWDNAINSKYGQIDRQTAFRLTYRVIREKMVPLLSLEDIIDTCLTCYDLHSLFDNCDQ